MLTPDIGFLDRRIAQEAGSLVRRGFSVDIYPVFDPLSRSVPGLPAGVRILTRPELPTAQRVGAYLRGRNLKRRLQRIAPAVHRLVHIAQTLLLDNAALSTKEDEAILLAGPRYDLLFAHDIPVLPLATRLARRWGAAVICDLHEMYPEQREFRTEWWTYRSLRRLQSKYLPLADGILSVNPAVRDYVEREVGLKAPFGVVYNSVPYMPALAEGAQIHDLYGIRRSSKVIAFAGSLRADANLDILIRAFDKAAAPGWSLALLGSGPEEGALRRTVDELGAGQRVFLGQRVAQHDLVPILASADAGVLPYVGIDLNHRHATPNKLFEYIQARLPIASAKLPEVARIVDPARVAAYLDFSNADVLASDLRSFLNEQVSDISPEALERAAHDICWERDEEALMEIVGAALRAKGLAMTSNAEAPRIAGHS
jgi:glycosyltransferase involved in cell wall biosynthesis